MAAHKIFFLFEKVKILKQCATGASSPSTFGLNNVMIFNILYIKPYKMGQLDIDALGMFINIFTTSNTEWIRKMCVFCYTEL